jgi:hypothetical protein
MKLRILLLAIVAFALSAPTALAHDNGSAKHAKAHEKAEAKKKSDRPCRPRVAVVAAGTLVSVGADGFTIAFEKGNRHAKRLAKNYGEQLYFTVKNEKKTKLRLKGHGKVSLEELTTTLETDPGHYRVLVKARVCKRYLKSTAETAPELYASWVKVKHIATEPDETNATDEKPETDGGTST